MTPKGEACRHHHHHPMFSRGYSRCWLPTFRGAGRSEQQPTSAPGCGPCGRQIQRPIVSVNTTIDMLAESGPGLGRPLVDTLQGSEIKNLKELRPRSGRDVAVRVLFVFDPWSQAVLLVAGNKAGNWSRWYQTAIPLAEVAYEAWLAFERKRRDES